MPRPSFSSGNDTQIAGVRDDGTQEGVVRAKIQESGLVPQPWKLVDLISENSVAFVAYGPGNDYDSDIHSGTYQLFNPAADPTRNGGGGGLWFPFYGKKLGLVIHLQNNFSNWPFTVEIDGVAYYIDPGAIYRLTYYETGNAFWARGHRLMVAEDLPDGFHIAYITLPADTASLHQMPVFGYLVEERVGYQRPRNLLRVLTEGQLAVSPGAAIYDVLNGISAAAGNRPGIRRIDYVNTDTVNRIVTITRGSAGAIRWQKTIAAGDTYSFDPGDFFSTGSGSSTSSGGLYHYADAAAKVNYTVIGDA